MSSSNLRLKIQDSRLMLLTFKQTCRQKTKGGDIKNSPPFDYFVSLFRKFGLLIQLAQIKFVGFDDFDLHIRETFRQIVFEYRVIADDDHIAAFQILCGE
jgi:hypothetical protein